MPGARHRAVLAGPIFGVARLAVPENTSTVALLSGPIAREDHRFSDLIQFIVTYKPPDQVTCFRLPHVMYPTFHLDPCAYNLSHP